MGLIVDNHMDRVLSEFRFRFAMHRRQSGRTASRGSGCQNGQTAFYYAKAFDRRWRGFRHQPVASRTLREAVVEFLMGPWDMNGGRRTQSRPTFDELLARATRVVKLKSWKIN